ncbi:uncharacterized protein LOC125859127 [Solanum stenotomum]|uniref:uncharacterized protein LOC125859127 n=1 Tax=Solanum stenotomum TaxID=172797 RepID=UPI0020D1AA63|nr:uncharacterized protein LOC125859127 [Solanum stenotomum]
MPNVFVGYPYATKGYKVLNLTTQKIHVSRDIIFHETIFPFAMSKDNTHLPSFPFHSVTLNDYPLSYNDNCNSSPSEQNDQDQIADDVVLVNAPTTDNTSCQPVPSTLIQHTSYVDTLSLPLRKSQRVHKIPTYLFDYVHTIPSPATSSTPSSSSLSALFFLRNHVPHVALAPDSQSFVMNVSHDCEPNSFEEASMDPAWQKAMTQEFTALHDNNTWTLTTLPIGKKSSTRLIGA